MRALGTLPPAQGMAAMQSINVVILNPWFLTPFLGSALTCLIAVLVSLRRWSDLGAACAANLWARYLSSWTAWNHVRTAAAFGAAVLFTIAFRIRA